jgi:hypothetical protein
MTHPKNGSSREATVYAFEPDIDSVIDEWSITSSDDHLHPITVYVQGTGIDLTIREAKAMRLGLSRAIKEHS